MLLFCLQYQRSLAFYPYQRLGKTQTSKDDSGRFIARNGALHGDKTFGSLRIPLKRPVSSRQKSYLAASRVKRDNQYTIATASPPKQADSLAVDQDGTDFSYFSALGFGSSGKTMYLLIDSGASSTWVMGSGCTTKSCQSHTLFGRADSNTLQTTGKTFTLAYGTGTVSGSAAYDNVDFGDFAVNVSFGLASDVSNDFLSYPMDGILGLGRPNSDEGRYPSVFEAIKAARSLNSNQFGVHLSSSADGETDGELNFGAPDTGRYDGSLSFTKTISNGPMWDIGLEDAGFDGQLCGFKDRTAIIDTGTSFMLLPPEDARKLHAQIPGWKKDGESYRVPCSTTKPLQLVFSGVAYNISNTDYIAKSNAVGEMCPTNIIGKKPFDANQWLVGDVFLKNVYTVFDFDESQVGFGVKGTTASASSSVDTSTTAKASTAPDAASIGATTTSMASITTSPGLLLPEEQSAAPTALSPVAATTGPLAPAASQTSEASWLIHPLLIQIGATIALAWNYLLI